MKVYRYVLLSKRDTEIDTRLDFLMTSGYPDIKLDKLHIFFIKYVIIWYFIFDEIGSQKHFWISNAGIFALWV